MYRLFTWGRYSTEHTVSTNCIPCVHCANWYYLKIEKVNNTVMSEADWGDATIDTIPYNYAKTEGEKAYEPR